MDNNNNNPFTVVPNISPVPEQAPLTTYQFTYEDGEVVEHQGSSFEIYPGINMIFITKPHPTEEDGMMMHKGINLSNVQTFTVIED